MESTRLKCDDCGYMPSHGQAQAGDSCALSRCLGTYQEVVRSVTTSPKKETCGSSVDCAHVCPGCEKPGAALAAMVDRHIVETILQKTIDTRQMVLATDSAARKEMPIASGVMDYFPAALAAIARLSKRGNDKHNPGQPLHWSRGKSGDHADCIARHLIDRGAIDPDDGEFHEVKLAWRALALLQEAEEARGAPTPRAAWVD